MTEREEQAFRDAFARAGEAFESKELDMELQPTPRRRAWPLVAAAAAAVVVVAGVSYAVVGTGGDRDPDVRQPVLPSETVGGELPAPRAGWHWESRYDLAVQVPDGWGYGVAPDDACSGSRAPTPYVDPFEGRMINDLVGCLRTHRDPMGPAPQRVWQTHVELDADLLRWTTVAGGLGGRPPEPGEYDGTWRRNGWTKVVKRIGMARLTVLYDEAHAEQAQRIVASARHIEKTNQDGCSITSPVQVRSDVYPRPHEAFDIDEVEGVSTIAVCQYRQAPAGVAGLEASRTLAGDAAKQVLTAIQQAPTGSGPNSPRNCIHDGRFDQALVLRLDGEHEIYVFNDSCVGNGFDDGTQMHQITERACGPLYGGPVRIFMSSGALGDACFPDR